MHRYECLAAVGVALDHIEAQGQRTRLGVEYADTRAALREIKSGAVMKATTQPLVYQLVRGGRSPPTLLRRARRSRRQAVRRDALDLPHGFGKLCVAVVLDALGKAPRILCLV